MPRNDTALPEPASDAGIEVPSATAWNVVPGPLASNDRSSQPVRVDGLCTPRSIWSCAWKWLRVTPGPPPTACTIASWPLSQ